MEVCTAQVIFGCRCTLLYKVLTFLLHVQQKLRSRCGTTLSEGSVRILDVPEVTLGCPLHTPARPTRLWLCRTGTEEWETLVPQHVRDQIKSLHLLGYNNQPRFHQLPSANGSGNGKSANGASKDKAPASAA